MSRLRNRPIPFHNWGTLIATVLLGLYFGVGGYVIEGTVLASVVGLLAGIVWWFVLLAMVVALTDSTVWLLRRVGLVAS